MNKLLLASLLLLCGCGGAEKDVPDQFKKLSDQLPKEVQLKVVIRKYNSQECKNAGGMWVQGDVKEWPAVFYGCVEQESGEAK